MVKPHAHPCPIAEVVNIFGDHWTLLVVREAFYGATRFRDFERHTKIAKNLLTDRLRRLVEADVLERRPLNEDSARFSYHLTHKGEALQVVMTAIHQWGNRYIYGPGNEPIVLVDNDTGAKVEELKIIAQSGRSLGMNEVRPAVGPGATRAVRKRFAEMAENDMP